MQMESIVPKRDLRYEGSSDVVAFKDGRQGGIAVERHGTAIAGVKIDTLEISRESLGFIGRVSNEAMEPTALAAGEGINRLA